MIKWDTPSETSLRNVLHLTSALISFRKEKHINHLSIITAMQHFNCLPPSITAPQDAHYIIIHVLLARSAVVRSIHVAMILYVRI